ncbi:MAG: hypothetical protein UZ04_CHB001000094 [Chlorobi bacterium OLB4]|nr:MAG: hypothetical protein UZ04_CHB001000094 [Chlorobi bacterium OLB4]MBW7856173.1 hypothetical protein [Ignavibacteria bacterium]OQY78013.1 MAG: hypothetical protein B6D43_05730 [Ignavibacteriales bacterium UTCHB1]
MRYIIFLVKIFFITSTIYSQIELVPVENPVYEYLKRMQLKELISFNSSDIPISRSKIASYIKQIDSKSENLTIVDKQILNDLKVEFQYELTGLLDNTHGIFNNGDLNLFNDKKQKYLYSFADSNASIFFDGIGSLHYGVSGGDTIEKKSLGFGKIGFRLRGTILNSIGMYLRADNGVVVSGTRNDKYLGTSNDPKLVANGKYMGDGFFETYEGHLRVATKNEIFSAIIGKESVKNGFGYIDKLFLSDNTVSFNFIGFNVNYKAIDYSFKYSSLKGDSLGRRDIEMKNLVSHRLTIKLSNQFRFGIFESLITVDRPFNITYLVPMSLIRAADYNAGGTQSDLNNALLGFDAEFIPKKKWAIQGSLLIDDLNFSRLFNNVRDDGRPGNDNRFGFQIGTIWTDAFSVPDFTVALEYTRLNQFVYTHRTNKSQYTNWGLPLGHMLSPNSDEIALKLNYNFSSRLSSILLFQYQRSAKGIVIENDSLVRNYGGDINRGDGDILFPVNFLDGNRINRYLFTFNLTWQPIRQYFIDLKFFYGINDKLYNNTKTNLVYSFMNFRIDY